MSHGAPQAETDRVPTHDPDQWMTIGDDPGYRARKGGAMIREAVRSAASAHTTCGRWDTTRVCTRTHLLDPELVMR
jgi:hypothetical protein